MGITDGRKTGELEEPRRERRVRREDTSKTPHTHHPPETRAREPTREEKDMKVPTRKLAKQRKGRAQRNHTSSPCHTKPPKQPKRAMSWRTHGTFGPRDSGKRARICTAFRVTCFEFFLSVGTGRCLA